MSKGCVHAVIQLNLSVAMYYENNNVNLMFY